jgi:hypothetical protein
VFFIVYKIIIHRTSFLKTVFYQHELLVQSNHSKVIND